MRSTLALVGFLGAIALPPVIPLVCITLLAIRYRAWEAIFIGLLIDLAWLPTSASIHTLPLFTLVGIAIVWGFEPLRAQFLVSQ